ncbi:alpha/beta-hydrolase [Hymenopellis radicata]|nr:alpha/beta-hydrolase [Hymenopellis radicata]
MVNLTAEASLLVGPVVFGTLVKHYFERFKKDKYHTTQLRRDELLYDEIFNLAKKFMEIATNHTVEELQALGNTRTPSPPWVNVIRVLVPMSCCDEAAKLLTKALGGEEVARRMVGGVKWWQVRGLDGVDGQWINAKKDWKDAKQRYEMREKAGDPTPEDSAQPAEYEQDMDDMRCILYFHGGGYFMGSVDQERYSIQRHARKINGRVFAVNYRLAPQYPFPCALQDVLASYLYLINPPPEAKHRPVKPSQIIIAGDSAGGGLSLALLQVIRDLGLPAPAGGVLISPWSDLTHSFPSVHLSTDTDVVPPCGMSLWKPSPLWPPPSDEMTKRVHSSLRARIRQTLKMDHHSGDAACMKRASSATLKSRLPADIGATITPPSVDSPDYEPLTLQTDSGETLTLIQQGHMYTPNRLLNHPLVSPALSYLGGLPPLLFIVSDKEVLRDEILYSAHKAAHPEKYPIQDRIRDMYPVLEGIESRYQATSVHLQVYDDTAHILPVLFSPTTPAKFCFRAIASFCKHVTGFYQQSTSPTTLQVPLSRSRSWSFSSDSNSSTSQPTTQITTSPPSEMTEEERLKSPRIAGETLPEKPTDQRMSLRSLSQKIAALSRRDASSSPLRSGTDSMGQKSPEGRNSKTRSKTTLASSERYAGEASVYHEGYESGSWDGKMIRERVSTKGVVRPLEPEDQLAATTYPPELLGTISELLLRRLIDAVQRHEKKFAHAIKDIEKQRRQTIRRAAQDIERNMGLLQSTLQQGTEGHSASGMGIKEGLIPSAGSWSWAWAIDGHETPPPSSIVSRRDTEEARRLAKIADLGVFQQDGNRSQLGNSLWSTMVDFLTRVGAREHEAEA